MARLLLTRSVRALTLGMALAGAVFAGSASPVGAMALAASPAGIAAVKEPGPPPSPEPVPNIDGPVYAGPTNQAPPLHHRRHHDDFVIAK